MIVLLIPDKIQTLASINVNYSGKMNKLLVAVSQTYKLNVFAIAIIPNIACKFMP